MLSENIELIYTTSGFIFQNDFLGKTIDSKVKLKE